MRKADLQLLERAFHAEIEAAISKSGFYMMQTKARKRADALVEAGLLRKVSERMHGPWPCTVDGYALTELGRLTYCTNCADTEVHHA
jgi:hypothetical protein